MSDTEGGVDDDGELPDWLSEAILSSGPPPDAIELVKASFTWRTIDAELLELSYDSALDIAGVRDAAAARTMEFVIGEASILIEVDGTSVTGRIIPAATGEVIAESPGATANALIDDSGAFTFAGLPSGPVRLVVRTAGNEWSTGAFSVG